LPQGAVQATRQLESSMKSAENAVNGVPIGGLGPANVAAFKEG
jgi:hypothetical protein